ncbi:hypothetical protein GE061_005170 [Apolygus lucorum]|uniref:FHOD1 N-terminal GTPase-binding domain-containing protein n=1 Tax=Apolygus lucorum TaxID=248454 RepID=A0A8S9WY46_APOLU|nr:hypothetical protein GE061_005170 [Apolygus lucorum]
MALTCRVQYLNDRDPFECSSFLPEPPRPPVHTFSTTLPLINQIAAVHKLLKAPHRLDDTALQLYKDGDYGPYLDLDASINEQQEEFESFNSHHFAVTGRRKVCLKEEKEKKMTDEWRERARERFHTSLKRDHLLREQTTQKGRTTNGNSELLPIS